jgi:hypothetical protein
LISRSHVIGLALAVGLMLAGGTGLAAADSGPSTATPTPAPTLCKVLTRPGVVTAVPSSGALPPVVKCAPEVVRGAIPKGAPGTGGGGMAAEVGSWH